MPRIKALIIDDSALIRQVLTEILSRDPGIEVVGTASDPVIAWEKIKSLRPDVLTLDVEMPRMDGLAFLDKLMSVHPMPVVMVSSLTEKGCETTLRALELGAVDFISKPKLDVRTGTLDLAEEIREKVKTAARARCRPPMRKPASSTQPRPVLTRSLAQSTQKLLVIGASTGGTEAIAEVLHHLPADGPGTVIVLHMPPGFTKSFAERLDGMCQMRVKEAQHGDRILSGHALLAPGGFHMSVRRSGGTYSVDITNGEAVNRHKPAVDVLMRSAAEQVGRNAVGVILTGMGNDGAQGLLAMQQAGARTIAQDEASCVVFGMPKEAIALNAVDDILPLNKIATRITILLPAGS